VKIKGIDFFWSVGLLQILSRRLNPSMIGMFRSHKIRKGFSLDFSRYSKASKPLRKK
jgi:hypothetical protein